jgi:hypothetical protein
MPLEDEWLFILRLRGDWYNGDIAAFGEEE